MEPSWRLRPAPEHLVDLLIRKTGCHPITATVLAARGISGVAETRAFLHPQLRHLPPPGAVADLSLAADRVVTALRNRERILVFGDYDADGVTSTALLYGFLRRLTSSVETFLPHRETDGYGLKPEQIPGFAKAAIRLIITVDCGIASHEAVEAASEADIDVVITDHHTVGETLPPACAVVDPKRSDCEGGIDPLAGVGVAFYLIIAIRKALRESGFWKPGTEPPLLPETDLVALGTVADLVPLVDANRILVRTGIETLRTTPRPGIRALCQVAGIRPDEMDGEAIAFRLAPRINAAGRMDHPDLALRLLLAEDNSQAMAAAEELDRLNTERQDRENRMVTQMEEEIRTHPRWLTESALVLDAPDWPVGIVGIAASRLVRKYHRPVAIITTAGGVGKASARSVPGFDLHHALGLCAPLLEQFGGHKMAAGFRIDPKKIPAFRKRFITVAKEALPVPHQETLEVDALLTIDDMDLQLWEELERLAPFGAANPAPLFVARDLELVSISPMGKDGSHRRMVLKQRSCLRQNRMQAVAFRVGTDTVFPHVLSTCLFRLRKNTYRNAELQMIIEGWS